MYIFTVFYSILLNGATPSMQIDALCWLCFVFGTSNTDDKWKERWDEDDDGEADDFSGDKDENNTLLALIVILLPFTWLWFAQTNKPANERRSNENEIAHRF